MTKWYVYFRCTSSWVFNWKRSTRTTPQRDTQFLKIAQFRERYYIVANAMIIYCWKKVWRHNKVPLLSILARQIHAVFKQTCHRFRNNRIQSLQSHNFAIHQFQLCVFTSDCWKPNSVNPQRVRTGTSLQYNNTLPSMSFSALYNLRTVHSW